jgi:hypothetical protein
MGQLAKSYFVKSSLDSDCLRASKWTLIHAVNEEDAMEKYIHEQNLVLLKRRLAEVQDEDQRKVILKLLAEEKAKDLPEETSTK